MLYFKINSTAYAAYAKELINTFAEHDFIL